MTEHISLEEHVGYYDRHKAVSGYYSGTCLEYILPEIHKRIYGVSFSNLPLELGGKLRQNHIEA